MKLLLKVVLIFVLSVSTAKANIINDLMNMGQSQSSGSRNGWVKVSIPEGLSDRALTAKLVKYPSIAVRYLNQHEDRIDGVQSTILEVLVNTHNEQQYRQYFKLAKYLDMRELPDFDYQGFGGSQDRDYQYNRNSNSRLNQNDRYEQDRYDNSGYNRKSHSPFNRKDSYNNQSYDEGDSDNVRVPGLYE